LRDIARFIKVELGEDVPWHISRFFPAYKMEHWQETPISSLLRDREIGREEGLRCIYLGNVPSPSGAPRLSGGLACRGVRVCDERN
jgi:pyruvate formate lyase activating enzyme